jgi:hypothetical protein
LSDFDGHQVSKHTPLTRSEQAKKHKWRSALDKRE